MASLETFRTCQSSFIAEAWRPSRRCRGRCTARLGGLTGSSSGRMVTIPSLATRHALAELLGKRDNDALRPADVG